VASGLAVGAELGQFTTWYGANMATGAVSGDLKPSNVPPKLT